MNAKEATALVAMIPGLFPATASRMNKTAAQQWAEVLCDPTIPADIARAAILQIAKRQPFIHVSEIGAAVHRMRRLAVRSVAHMVPSTTPPPEPAAYLEHLQERQRIVRDIADQAIRDGALDFRDVDLAHEDVDDWGEPDEVPVDVDRLALPPAAPALPPADPARARQIIKDATPREGAA